MPSVSHPSGSHVHRPPDDPRELSLGEQVALVPGLARLAAGACYRTAAWGVGTTLKATRRLGEAAISGESPAELLEEARTETVDGVRRLLGIGEEEVPGAGGDGAATRARRGGSGQPDPDGVRSLRERGAELLDRAADVDDVDDLIHPGFARIIDQLAPDEARILKLLINEGPQGIVYVNKAAPFGIGAREVARRLSMIGKEAGCLHPEFVPAYLDNLVSHGLVAIRRDALADELPYQVIEAQPEVLAAIAEAGGTLFRGQVTRRSVHLTDFGRTFCQVCFPPEHLTGEFEAIEVDGEVVEVAPPETHVD